MTEPDDSPQGSEGDRIAKVLARAGIASRRDAEKIIAEGRVSVNGEKLLTPAFKVPPGAIIQVDGKIVAGAEPTRMWRYYKPAGLVTSHRDEKGRPTVFQHLPAGLPRVISVGRLDLNSEGLLLLTNDGALSRRLELPETGWTRRYRVRFFGTIAQAELDRLKDGITIDGVRYGPIEAQLERSTGQNAWAAVALKEGKNREVRRVFEHFGLRVSRLIRIAYGPFQLGDLREGEVAEISGKVLKEQLGLAKNPRRTPSSESPLLPPSSPALSRGKYPAKRGEGGHSPKANEAGGESASSAQKGASFGLRQHTPPSGLRPASPRKRGEQQDRTDRAAGFSRPLAGGDRPRSGQRGARDGSDRRPPKGRR